MEGLKKELEQNGRRSGGVTMAGEGKGRRKRKVTVNEQGDVSDGEGRGLASSRRTEGG